MLFREPELERPAESAVRDLPGSKGNRMTGAEHHKWGYEQSKRGASNEEKIRSYGW